MRMFSDDRQDRKGSGTGCLIQEIYADGVEDFGGKIRMPQDRV
jgi:hypothetical protein